MTILDRLKQIATLPDTPAPGLTKYIPQHEVSNILLNPLGVYSAPPPAEAGETYFQELTIDTNAKEISLPAHEHAMFSNQGVNTIRMSKDAARWFNVLPSGMSLVWDGHKENRLWLSTSAGASVIVITTW